ncbi:MAG: 3-dehydroquinate synthase, partial [Candidatus Omnitrophica bacterium]|nr:3-dehydroquinate synthase [Candidatus Omnitrophota bacterium]
MGTLIKEIKINLKDFSYKILIGKGILKKTGYFIKRLDLGNYAYIISNSYIAKRYAGIITNSFQRYSIKSILKLVEDTEEAKSLTNALFILKDIVKKDNKGYLFIVALGGGVVGDLAGFIAGIYKRGIPYIQIPTTLLAQIDSSIGGKTAVDLKEAKNLVGLFYQPYLVLSDIDCLKSLDLRQLRSGLAEAIKYGIIKNGSLLNYIEANYKKLLSLDEDAILKLVYLCAKIKAEIVQRD